jgi:hypothetical protein
MPEQAAVVIVPKLPKGAPPAPFQTWCDWAQDGLRKALEGMGGATSGVAGYKIGTRAVQYKGAGEQGKSVDYWMRLVEYYCGIDALPTALTGRDSAVRVVPRDI